jgi:hypothetical protein
MRAALIAGVAGLALAGWYFGLHAPEQRKIELARLEAQRAEAARLAAARGGLIIRTEPAGAEVAVGGVGIERSPATFREMRLGEYEVTVTKAGHEPQNLKLRVEENRFTQPGVITLAPTTGGVELTSEPAGLDYELRSTRLVSADVPAVRRTGQTPATLSDLPVGAYAVTFRRSGWPEQTKTVEIGRKAAAKATADFSPGRLVVTSTPSGAEVVSGGQVVGRTPFTLPEVMPGRQSVELRLKGYKGQTLSGTVVAREELRLNATLEPQLYPQPGQPHENTLGMKFVPVPGTNVLFSIWETRVQDFEAFVRETSHDATQGMYSDRGDGWKLQGDTWRSPGFPQGPTHPVVGVNQADAKAFCEWLTKRERAAGRLGPDQSYRLPTDAEWDAAVGPTEFPWGNQWPPPRGAGNYADEAAKRGRYKSWAIISGYDDGYDATAPVGSFTANAHGLYDLGGNVWEYVDDRAHGLRGASFNYSDRGNLASAYRSTLVNRYDIIGFRVVCVVGSAR